MYSCIAYTMNADDYGGHEWVLRSSGSKRGRTMERGGLGFSQRGGEKALKIVESIDSTIQYIRKKNHVIDSW